MNPLIAPDRFETPEFTLRSYREDDGPALRDATNSSYEHLAPFMPWATPHQSAEEAEALVRRFRGNWLLSTDFVIALVSPDDRELFGGGGFHLREGSLETCNAEMGMWIRASRAGQGLGTRFLASMLEWGFTAWPWERLSWRCDAENAASIRIAEKVGLRREGTLTSHMLAPDGKRRDTVCFAILRREWADRHAGR